MSAVPHIAPVVLASDVHTLAATETRALSDPKHLENPFMGGMEVDEIRFYAPTFIGTVNETQYELRLGDELLTGGFVPTSLFAPLIDSGLSSVGTHVWRLPKPLYLRRGDRIFVNMRNPHTTLPASAGIVALGRPVGDAVPRVTNIPYVKAWIASACNDPVAYGSYDAESTEADLVNPFPIPLRLQRLIGIVYGSGFRASWWKQADSLKVQIVDSKGGFVVRDPTPFTNLFFRLHRAWNINTVMAPRQHFDAQLHAEPGWNIGTPAIALVGYRQATSF